MIVLQVICCWSIVYSEIHPRRSGDSTLADDSITPPFDDMFSGIELTIKNMLNMELTPECARIVMVYTDGSFLQMPGQKTKAVRVC